jgi:hypothetical protein
MYSHLFDSTVIDWDEGVERVVGFKTPDFQLISFLLECRELRGIMSTFISRARTYAGYLVGILSGGTLFNNLVVRPTVADIQAYAASSAGIYDEVYAALRRLRTPTKFSTKPKFKSTRWTADERIVAHIDYGFDGYMTLMAKPQYRVVIKRKGSGTVAAAPFINTVLLSALTSSYVFNAETVWNFVPFSFIVDYFIPVADALSQSLSSTCEFYLTNCVDVAEITIQARWASFRYVKTGPFGVSMTVSGDAPSFTREFIRELVPEAKCDGKDLVINSVPDLSFSQGLNTFIIAANFLVGSLTGGRGLLR